MIDASKYAFNDDELDRLWRKRFGQPLPVRGCPEAIIRVLNGEPRVIIKHPPVPKCLEMRRVSRPVRRRSRGVRRRAGVAALGAAASPA